MNFIQSLRANNSSRQPKRQANQQKTALPTKEKIWFNMYLTKDRKQIDNTVCHEGKAYCRVDAGETYTLVVLGNGIISDFHNYRLPIEFSTPIKIQIQCIANAQMIFQEERTITCTDANSYRQEFSLHIEAEIPSCELALRMGVVIAADDIRNLGTKTLFIHGRYEIIQPQFLRECQIASRPPDNISILSISPHPDLSQRYSFTIQGWNAGRRLSTAQYYNSQPVSIHQITQTANIPGNIRARIRNIAGMIKQQDKNLPAWLTWLEKTYNEDCYLIIEDESALEIPWEMLELQGDYHYLGTAMRVVRWISRGIRDISTKLKFNAEPYQGSVISYLDRRLLEEDTAAERKILQRFQIDDCSDLSSLKQRIKITGNLTQTGLIYIGSHGKSGHSLYMAENKIFTANQLLLMDEHAYPRPLAFFNACESARLGLIGAFDNNNFVITLLERIVQGYIGTLAAVDSTEASKVAHSFLSSAYDHPERPIAAILQQIRREAAKNLKQGYETLSDDDPQEIALENTFLNTFMYVYYGNPLACLQLKPHSLAIAI